MSLSLTQMRANCSKARAAMERAQHEHFALGAFNLDNQDILKAVMHAAKNKNAPLMVEVSHGEVEALGLDNIRDMVDNYKEEFGTEVYVNLDHSPSVAAAIAGIEAGYEFIHIDISQARKDATVEEIITETRQIVDYARLTGAMIESEPHYFGGGSNLFTKAFDYEEVKKTFSTPDSARDFVDATGIDTFAAAIGNLHGKYPVPKKLDIDLLREIRAAIDCNISLHGGSGTPGHYFIEAVKVGVTKVNINSDMRVAYRKTLEQVLDDNPHEFAIVKLMDEVIESVRLVVESKIDMFNAAGKAQP
ncbi:MAG TPA: class II fructose-bisphosphate aldolase [Verrucomicrobiae bacterium]|nr:class II fructose-bisphosphate aldolase [Verrucomicrobiae bacterium]